MSTIVEICNDALLNIRGQSINSLNESTREAQVCKLKYPLVVEKVLREFNWSFAKKTQPLALRTETLHRWRLCYQYPSDALKIRDVTVLNIPTSNTVLGLYGTEYQEPDYTVPYEVLTVDGVKVIGCNIDDVVAEYTWNVVDPNLFDPIFKMMLGWYMGSQIAVPIMGVGKGQREQRTALEQYAALKSEALKNDDEEQGHTPTQETDLITGRY